ncbi:MAP kinase kinase kinase [Brachionus plicatilis]|uniref:MAP kinase kinase kinase n=1 Tax=Brachionus plicatilis TaxID=10195 RepID=A0A3M7PJE7_BRAPC|nr:MAP kinase kinase kinase [Brachionus plicatilis]
MIPSLISGVKSNLYAFFKKVNEGEYNSIHESKIIKYRKIDIIGKGSFGIVYSAVNQNGEMIAVKHKKEPKNVAFKVISNLLFSEELESLNQLNHRNIVRLLGVEFTFKGPISIIMEYIEGVNLEKIIKIQGVLAELTIKTYCRQLIDALAYLHSKNIIHRDIKSTNVMIESENFVKLVDFGMAKKAYPSAYTIQSDSNSTIVGTIAYMAPEIVTLDKYNATIDVFSLGVLIFEMANGEPFLGTKRNPVPLCQSPTMISLDNLSSKANNFMQNCLVKDFKVRPRATMLCMHPFVTR